jgi:predicted glycosyltransferase
MKIVVDINHPAHVHFFKNFIWNMVKKGHQVLVTCSKKDIAENLLNKLNIDYTYIGDYGSSITKKLLNLPILDYNMYKSVKEFKPDLFLGINSIRAAHISRLLNKTSFTFTDTEHSWEQRALYMPFTDVVCTPDCFKLDLGNKHIKYKGYHELAYLHPNYFKPDPSVLDDIRLGKDDTFFIVRFVSWEATHDVGKRGIVDKENLVKWLEKYGSVLITSEKALPYKLEKYRINITPEKIHDLLYYSTLYVGEGGTMASEAAVLGTHSIFISSLGKYCGIFTDQAKYGLQYICESDNDAFNIAKELLENKQLQMLGKAKQKNLLHDKIDVTTYLTHFVEEFLYEYTK